MKNSTPLSDNQVAQQIEQIERQKKMGSWLAIWQLRRLARQCPDNWRPLFNLGYYFRRRSDSWLNRFSPWYRLSIIAAISAYDRCLELCPEHAKPSVWKDLAGLYGRIQQDDVALSYASRAALAKPDSLDNQINLAIAYFNSRQDVPRAKAILQEALKKQPNADDIKYGLRRIALYEEGVNARIRT